MTRPLPEELRCQELVELVTTYFDDALDVDERTRLEQHLTYCGGCRTFVDQLRAERRLLEGLEGPAVPDGTRARLVDAFRRWKEGRK